MSVKVAAQSREAGVQGADVQVRHVELIGDGVSPPYTTAPGSASARARAPPLCPDSATGVSCCADMPRGQGCGVDDFPGDSDSDSDSDPPESTPTPTPTPESTPALFGPNIFDAIKYVYPIP